MDEVHAVWKDGQIVPEGPVDWPEGSRLRIEPEPASAVGASEEEWSNAPKAIADWLAWYDSLEPLIFTQQEEDEIRDWRRRLKEYTTSRMEKADGIGSHRLAPTPPLTSLND